MRNPGSRAEADCKHEFLAKRVSDMKYASTFAELRLWQVTAEPARCEMSMFLWFFISGKPDPKRRCKVITFQNHTSYPSAHKTLGRVSSTRPPHQRVFGSCRYKKLHYMKISCVKSILNQELYWMFYIHRYMDVLELKILVHVIRLQHYACMCWNAYLISVNNEAEFCTYRLQSKIASQKRG